MNTSAVSPFASLGSSEGEDSKTKTTSSSAFAASGLASFAGQEQSPFGALGKPTNTPSVFSKSVTTSDEKKPVGSGFAAATTTSSASPFGNTGASGFAALGSSSAFGGGFGSVGGGFGGSTGGKLSSFASATSSGFGGSPAKAFGADQDAEEEEEQEEESNAVTGTFEKEKEDERFYEQQSVYPFSFFIKLASCQSKEKLLTATVETGEEEEHTYFSSKAKLFHFSDKVWKERGVGTFKVNVKESPDDSDSDVEAGNKKKSARMIMRADGVLRVMLNSPIFKGMPIGDVLR